MKKGLSLLRGMLGAVMFFLLSGSMPLAANWNPLSDTGQTNCYDRTGNKITCPVEGQPMHGQDAQYHWQAPSFQDNGNRTVTDFNTGLMWQHSDDGIIRSWQAAIDYCFGLSLGGYNDWRLPMKFELQSIIDYGRYEPAINPIFSCRSSFYWSATTSANSSADAWFVHYQYGQSYWFHETTPNFYVRCVRNGP